MKNLFLFLIRFYRGCASIFFSPCCRFYPTCSAYAEEAIEKKGSLQGLSLIIKRILKCHPFHRGGIDLVPGEKNG